MTSLNIAPQGGEPFTTPRPTMPAAMDAFVDIFSQDPDNLRALMGGLGCAEADTVINLLRAARQEHMAEVALTCHAERDDDIPDMHYLTDEGFGRSYSPDAPVCTECGTRRDVETVRGINFCPSCLHDAERSGW